MKNRLTLYLTEGHCSVTVDITVSRQTSANDLPAMVQGMPADDRAVLEQFCRAVLALTPSVTVDDLKARDGDLKARAWAGISRIVR